MQFKSFSFFFVLRLKKNCRLIKIDLEVIDSIIIFPPFLVLVKLSSSSKISPNLTDFQLQIAFKYVKIRKYSNMLYVSYQNQDAPTFHN